MRNSFIWVAIFALLSPPLLGAAGAAAAAAGSAVQAAHAEELQGAAARTLLQGGCQYGALPALPSNARWSSASCRQTAGEAAPNDVCAAECLPGFSTSGSRSLICLGFTINPPWGPGPGAQDLSCTGCAGTPDSATLPANAAWSCGQSPGSAPGSTCSAVCAAGYVQVGSWSSLCAFAPGGQAWQAPSGSGITCSPEVPQGSCSNSPGPSLVGMPLNAQWACSGQVTLSGSICQASCAAGYANVAPTVREAACLNGVWRAPTGSMSCVQGTAPCLQPPPSAWLPVGGKWDCKFTPHAAACTASCGAQYTKSGNTLAWCYNGQYSPPATNITCTPVGCSSSQVPQVDPVAIWACKVPAAHGSNCSSDCNTTALVLDPPTVTCNFGTWVYTGGSCNGVSIRNYYVTATGPQDFVLAVARILARGEGTIIGQIIMNYLNKLYKLFAQFISIFAGAFAEAAKEVVKLGLDFKVVGVWVAGALNNTANSTQARQLLMQQGLDGLVIGVQVSFGEGVVAETVESVVDAAVNTPSFMSFVFAQGLAIGRNTYSVDESILQQVTLTLSDSAGNPIGASAGAGNCLMQLTPSMQANSSAGIISATETSGGSAVAVCAGANALYTTFDYQGSSTVTNSTVLTASIANSNTTTCSLSPDIIPVGNTNTSVAVTCRNINGTPFSDTASYQVVVTASSNCSGVPLLTAAATDITTVPRPTVTVRLARRPAPVCGGKPAVATFQYTVNGLQPGQDFSLAAQVGANCTTNLTSTPSKANGTAVVTCSGAFAPGVTVPVELNITAATQGCGTATGSAKGNVSVLCCTRGSSYAKTGSSTAKANCFKHVRPGAAGSQCAKAPTASGFFNRGPGAGKLFLAQNASSCTDAVGVGSVRVSCPEGGAAKRLLFKLVTPAPYRSFERRYWVGCAAPTSSTACPGSTRWIRINATSTLEFNVTAPAGCSCASAYHGIVDFAAYRRLPLSACGK